jgi:hypothetical protein
MPQKKMKSSEKHQKVFAFITLSSFFKKMSAAAPARRSAVQKRVVSLYRSLFRVIKTKPVENQDKMRSAVRTEFRARSTLDRKDFFRVDYFVRRAEKYLNLLKRPSCKDIDVVFEEDLPPRPTASPPQL